MYRSYVDRTGFSGRKWEPAARGAQDEADTLWRYQGDVITWWRHHPAPAPVSDRPYLPCLCEPGGETTADNHHRMPGTRITTSFLSETPSVWWQSNSYTELKVLRCRNCQSGFLSFVCFFGCVREREVVVVGRIIEMKSQIKSRCVLVYLF